MAYGKYNYNQSSDDETKMAWDLRQFNSRFISSYIIDFKDAETSNNYPLILWCLDKWFNGAKHEWLDFDKKDSKWEELRTEFDKFASKHESVYLNKSFKSQTVYEIREKLQKMKAYLLFRMKKSGVFGQTWNDDGL